MPDVLFIFYFSVSLTMKNTQSVTHRNLRGILLQTSTSGVQHITEDDSRMIGYHPHDESAQWRIAMIQEVMEIRLGEATLPKRWTWGELETVLEDACVT